MPSSRIAVAAAVSVLALMLGGCAEVPAPATVPSGTTSSSGSDAPAASEEPKVSGTGTAAVGGDPLDVQGEITVPAADTTVPSGTEGCTPSDDYKDAGPGAKVTVKDPAGNVLATTTLDDGVFDGEACLFTFEVESVVGTFENYGIEVAERGVVSWTRQEVDEDVLQMDLTE